MDVVDLTLTERMAPSVVAVIPYKGKLEMTQNLVGQLVDEGVPVIALNNGERDEQVAGAEVTQCSGQTIHQMWNEGLRRAQVYWPDAHVALLNNDIELSPNCLPTLAEVLHRRWDLMLVSPNYDERRSQLEVEKVTGICAGRYDGTGGIAGFAMVLTNRLARQWRFDERMQWWFGDADLALEVERVSFGQGLGIHIDTWVRHLDGGGQTAGDWFSPEWKAITEADRAVFQQKWGMS